MKSPRPPRTVSATEFKTHCLALMDEVQQSGEEIVITKHGKPVARVLPAERASGDLIGALRGRIRVNGDIQTTGLKWDASG